MATQDQLERLITSHKRRLYELEKKQAVLGLSADPSLSIEIEEIEERIKALQGQLSEQKSPKDSFTDNEQLLVNYHRRLQRLREQQALKGRSVDPSILFEIEEIEEKIEALQKEREETTSLESPRMESKSGYDIATIRRVFLDSFSDEELTIFCFENFRPVYDGFSHYMTKSNKVQLLLGYCDRYDEFETLLKLINKHKPQAYSQGEAEHTPISGPRPPSTTTPGGTTNYSGQIDIGGEIFSGRDIIIGRDVSVGEDMIKKELSDVTKKHRFKWWLWIPVLALLIGLCNVGLIIYSGIDYSIAIADIGDFFASPIMLSIGTVIAILGIAFALRQPIIASARQIGAFFAASVEKVRVYGQSVQENRAQKFENRLLGWRLYVDEELSKHNHIYLHKLKRIPRWQRQKVVDLYMEGNPHVLYDQKHKCLMHRNWPQLKEIKLARENLVKHLQSDADTFGDKFVTFIKTLEEPFGISLAHGRSLVRFEQFVSHKVEISDIFPDLNLQQKEVVICTTQYSQPTLDQMKQLYNFVKEEQGASIALLVLFSDTENAEQLQKALYREFRHETCDMIVITCTNLMGWLKAERPTRDEFRRAVVCNTRLKAISPFVISGPTPEKMFVGREEELQQIRDHIVDKSFAITGGRRVGKTSIALRLHRGFLSHRQFYTIYQDVSPITDQASFLGAPILDWRPNAPGIYQTFGDLFSGRPLGRKVVLILDEVDKLARVDSTSGWPIFNRLRALTTSGHIRMVLLGERGLRSAMLDSSGPFFNYAEELFIGRLDFENVEKLITRPLEKMEIFYEPAIVRRIYDFTSGHPNVVQRLCYRLIENLDKRNDRRLGLRDVDMVINDPDFQIVDFFGTYFSHATLLERIIVVLLAQAEQLPRSGIEIQKLVNRQLGLIPSQRDTNEALERLVKLRSILTYAEGYTFAVSAIPELLSRSKTTVANDWLVAWREEYEKQGDATLEDIDKVEKKS